MFKNKLDTSIFATLCKGFSSRRKMLMTVICFAHCKSQHQRVLATWKQLKEEVVWGERWAVCLLRVGIGHPWSRVSPSSPWVGLVTHKEPSSHRPWLFYRYSTILIASMFPPVSWGCTCCLPAFPQAAGEQGCLCITRNTQCQRQLGKFLTGLVRHWKKASNHNHIWN